LNKADAQRRADRIRFFREELAQLDREGIVPLHPDARAALIAHHEKLLAELVRTHDVDVSEEGSQLSWGMRIASLLGALALCAAAWFFFYRIWGDLSTSAQVAMLVAAPLLALGLTELAARRERTLYVAGICALIALACFVLNLAALGAIFNTTPTQHAFLIWAGFAFLLGYAYGLKLVVAAGMVSLAVWLGTTAGTLLGSHWEAAFERPGNFLPAGLLLFFVPSMFPHRRNQDFPAMYHVFGLLGIFLPLLALSGWGGGSYLLWPDDRVEAFYQILALVISSLVIWAGIRRGAPHVVNTGAAFFVSFLYMRLFDWWWDWMPRYLFFLVIGLVALGLLMVMRRLRTVIVGRSS